MRLLPTLVLALAACGPSLALDDLGSTADSGESSSTGEPESLDAGESTGELDPSNDPRRAPGRSDGSSTGFAPATTDESSSGGEPCVASSPCGDLARDAAAECPQLADGSPDAECIAAVLPEECDADVSAIEDEALACLFAGEYPECPFPSLDGVCR